MSPSQGIHVSNVNKSFRVSGKQIDALKDLCFHVRKSSITGLIGKSGSGKSTLLRCITGLESPDEGSISIDGTSIHSCDAKHLLATRKRMGIVFQALHLVLNRSVYHNIALPLEIRGFSKKEILSKVTSIAQDLGIGDKLDAFPNQLSGGQKQRVALARALVPEDVDFLLCDEFTSALDEHTTSEILALLKKIRIQRDLTIFIITHNLSIVEQLCDYSYTLEAGRIIQEGDVK